MNPYEVLGIAEGASLDAIQAAYREKARRYHPDLGGDAWAFRQIESAYWLLTSGAAAEMADAVEPQPPTATDPSWAAVADHLGPLLGLATFLGISWWFGWSGLLAVLFWLGVATTSGCSLYCAWSAWGADARSSERRKFTLLGIFYGVAAGVLLLLMSAAFSTAALPRTMPRRTVLARVVPLVKGILTGFRFREGQRYAEWRSGDKVAQYGLGALVVGGGTAVAAKTGLLAKLWKPILAVIVAIIAWLKRGRLQGALRKRS